MATPPMLFTGAQGDDGGGGGAGRIVAGRRAEEGGRGNQEGMTNESTTMKSTFASLSLSSLLFLDEALILMKNQLVAAPPSAKDPKCHPKSNLSTPSNEEGRTQQAKHTAPKNAWYIRDRDPQTLMVLTSLFITRCLRS